MTPYCQAAGSSDLLSSRGHLWTCMLFASCRILHCWRHYQPDSLAHRLLHYCSCLHVCPIFLKLSGRLQEWRSKHI